MAFEDTVNANILNVDLYSIIKETKEAQYKEYGKHTGDSFDEKAPLLESEIAQKILQEDRLSREIVRGIISEHRSIAVEGCNAPAPTYPSLVFMGVSEKEIRDKVFALMNEGGLLDFQSGLCGHNYWCFESEVVYMHSKQRGMGKCEFQKNQELRDELTEMLSPFEAEKPLYVKRWYSKILPADKEITTASGRVVDPFKATF